MRPFLSLQRRLRGHGELLPRDDAADASRDLRGFAGGAALHQHREVSQALSLAAVHAQPAHHRRRRPRAEEAGESATAAGDRLQGQLRDESAPAGTIRPPAVARARVDGEGVPECDDSVRAGVRGGGEFARGAATRVEEHGERGRGRRHLQTVRTQLREVHLSALRDLQRVAGAGRSGEDCRA